MPEVGKIADIREPIVKVTLFMPQDYVGPVMTLCNNKRGVQVNMSYHGRQVHLVYEIPLAEIVLDFFDKLKSVSRGYASMDYEFLEYRSADVVRVDLLINNDRVDAGRDRPPQQRPPSRPRRGDAHAWTDSAPDVRRGDPGRHWRRDHCARERQGAAQNVLAKCYGGDISRKKKLLESRRPARSA